MSVEYTRRAVADLHKIGTDSAAFGATVSAELEGRIRELVDRIAQNPEIGARVAERPGIRVMPLGRFPYKIFYRVLADRDVRVLHVRHTARRPWRSQPDIG